VSDARTKRPPLRELYHELNVELFDGRLPAVQLEPTFYGNQILLTERKIVVRRVGLRMGALGLRSSQGYCLGAFRPAQGVFPPEIRVASRLGADSERRVLLHEMAHCSVWLAGFHDEGHGAHFIAELHRLAALGEAWATEQAAHYLAREGRAEALAR